MCGITGYVDYLGRSIDQGAFENITRCLAHRGPDDMGIKLFPGTPHVVLGHTRLSIIDLSPAGHQPMSNDDGTLWITYNGEIYNYLSLREELKKKGHVFRSQSDTEVIVKAYESWGDKCLERFNGMFAFAIYDTSSRKLFAARDRIGVKPFYFYAKDGLLIFASEIKAILASELFQAAPDYDSIITPTRFQISPHTGFKNIHKLQPAHYLVFESGRLDIKRYWNIELSDSDLFKEEVAINDFDELLSDAVRLQMVADVPVGVLLSGGLDSSIISALMKRNTAHDIHSFTIKFAEKDRKFERMPDDSFYAKQVAQQFDLRHHEFEISPDVTQLLPKMVWHLDEPLTDPAAINTYLISKAARENGIVVLLNGMGGDEIFGGYRKHLACLLAEQYETYMPFFLRRAVDALVEALPTATSTRAFRTIRWAKRFISFSYPPFERFIASDLSLDACHFAQMFDTDLQYEQTYYYQSQKKRFENQNISYLTQMCLNDTNVFLPEHNLTYSDKACMAIGVESRPALTDHRIVEFMFKMPPASRIKGVTQKYLLKKVAERYLPKRIVYRPKAPFGVPLRSWVRRDLREMVDDLLTPHSLKKRGIYKQSYVSRLIELDRKKAFP